MTNLTVGNILSARVASKILAVALALPAMNALGSTVPYGYQETAGTNVNSGAGTAMYINPAGGYSAATIMADTTVGLTMSGFANGGNSAGATALFNVEVSGPGETNALVDISGMTSATLTNGAVSGDEAYAFFGVSPGTGGSTYLYTACGGAEVNASSQVQTIVCTSGNVNSGPGSFSTEASMATNTSFNVLLVVTDISHDSGLTNLTSASSQIDPYFQLDPSFTGSNPGYSLTFSPFFDNVPGSSVPEPGPGLLCAVGAAALFIRLRMDRCRSSRP